MSYVIVTGQHTVVGAAFASYDKAFNAALHLFGAGIEDWIARNLRIEEAAGKRAPV